MAANGNYGRFSERIKKIVFRKRNRKIVNHCDEDAKIIYNNVLKVLAAIPGIVYNSVHIDSDNKSNNNVDEYKDDNTLKEDTNNLFKINSIDVNMIKRKKLLLNKKNSDNYTDKKLFNTSINNVDNIADNKVEIKEDNDYKTIHSISNSNMEDKIQLLTNFNKEDQLQVQKDITVSNDKSDMNISKKRFYDENEMMVQKLEKEILDIIKKKLVLSINNLEILQSELYIISEVNGDSKNILECERQIKEIKILLNKVNNLKEQYDFLRDNYEFEYIMALDDNNLIDKIIELKDIFGNNQVRMLVQDYKLLEEFKYLYFKIDKLQDKTNNLEKNKQKQLDKLEDRNINFEDLKSRIYNIDNANNLYNAFVKEQSELISQIDGNVSKINSYEQVDYHLKGFNKLLVNSFKYFGLLMLNPLKGIFPAIVSETLITRNIVNNLYGNLKWEEDRKIIYEAIDYSSSLDSIIHDIDVASNNVDMTLSDLVVLKMEYNKKFKLCHGDINEYKAIIDKIENMENKILGNKIKIEIMKKRTIEQKNENNKKLILVNNLNKNEKKM